MIFDDTSLLDDLSGDSMKNSIKLEEKQDSLVLNSRKNRSSLFKQNYFQKYKFMLAGNQQKKKSPTARSFGDNDFGSVKVSFIWELTILYF